MRGGPLNPLLTVQGTGPGLHKCLLSELLLFIEGLLCAMVFKPLISPNPHANLELGAVIISHFTDNKIEA